MAKFVLGISGSPRKDGNTDIAVQEALRQMEAKGDYRIKFIRLWDFEIKRCLGCRKCMKLNHCAIQDDDLEKVLEMTSGADILVVGSPVYWNSPPGVMKDFMDRSHGYYAVGGIFSGKRAALIGVATAGGFEPQESAIGGWLRHYGADLVSMIRIYAREKGDLPQKPQEMAKIAGLVEALCA